jgi:hypothetical protein
VGLKIGATVVILTGRDEARFVYLASNVYGLLSTGHRPRQSGVARPDAEGKSGGFGGWALGGKGRDDFLEKFVV